MLKHGRASELASQNARCDVFAENGATKTSTSCSQVLDFNEGLGFAHFEFTPLGRFHKICEMSERCVSRYLVSDDHAALVGNDCIGSAASLPRRLRALGT